VGVGDADFYFPSISIVSSLPPASSSSSGGGLLLEEEDSSSLHVWTTLDCFSHLFGVLGRQKKKSSL